MCSANSRIEHDFNLLPSENERWELFCNVIHMVLSSGNLECKIRILIIRWMFRLFINYLWHIHQHRTNELVQFGNRFGLNLSFLPLERWLWTEILSHPIFLKGLNVGWRFPSFWWNELHPSWRFVSIWTISSSITAIFFLFLVCQQIKVSWIFSKSQTVDCKSLNRLYSARICRIFELSRW